MTDSRCPSCSCVWDEHISLPEDAILYCVKCQRECPSEELEVEE